MRDSVEAGYASAEYVHSLAEFGDPLHLPACNGWVLRRQIDDAGHRDAMGPYPLFFCRNWGALADDLSDLSSELVSVVLVTDPFGDFDTEQLERSFDQAALFKHHYIAELDRSPQSFVSSSHRANARRALRDVDVSVCERPSEHLDSWESLFSNLCRRHSVSGLRAFSRQAFAVQLQVPGLVMFVATAGGTVVGLDLWYEQGDVAYGHLAAFSDAGYALGASYATKWTMLHHFSGSVKCVDLAGTPGLAPTESSGLGHFKRGWSTGTKPVYLCTRALQVDVYNELSRHAAGASYFPAYRDGELA